MSKRDAIVNAASQPNDVGVGEMVLDGALKVAETGLPGVGPIGYVAGIPFSWIVADRDAEKELQKIADDFRPQLAAQFGVPEAAVSSQMVLMAANQNEAIARAVQSVEWKKDAHAWVNGAGIGGMAAGVGAAAMIAGGPPTWLALGAATIAGSFLGEGVGRSLFGPDENLNPLTHLNTMKEKVGKVPYQEIAADVFRMRVAQSKGLQEHIAQVQGKEFFALDAEDQLRVMNEMRPLLDSCVVDAQAATQPGANLNMLMFGGLADSPVLEFAQAGVKEFQEQPPLGQVTQSEIAVPASWAQRVGGSRQGRQGSWVERSSASPAAGVSLPQ